jgi:hypothetical protein
MTKPYGTWVDILENSPEDADPAEILESWKKDAYDLLQTTHELQEKLNAAKEQLRWIPVEEELPKDILGGASEYVEVIYASWNEETGEISPYYYRKCTQYWHKYGVWEYMYRNGPQSFEEYGYKVLFWMKRIPMPEPKRGEDKNESV